jgi:hypothetical protein
VHGAVLAADDQGVAVLHYLVLHYLVLDDLQVGEGLAEAGGRLASAMTRPGVHPVSPRQSRSRIAGDAGRALSEQVFGNGFRSGRP